MESVCLVNPVTLQNSLSEQIWNQCLDSGDEAVLCSLNGALLSQSCPLSPHRAAVWSGLVAKLWRDQTNLVAQKQKQYHAKEDSEEAEDICKYFISR